MYVGGRVALLYGGGPTRRACPKIAERVAEVGAENTRWLSPRGPARVPPNVPPLHDSIYVTPAKHRGPDVYEAKWATDKEYAPYIEHGWGLGHEPDPHTKYPIRPKKPGGVLHFFVNGHEVFTTLVMHPGAKGQHMFARAAAILEHTLGLAVKPALEEWAREQREEGAHQTPIVVRGLR